MKKFLVLLLAIVVIIASIFVSCSKKEETNDNDLNSNDTEFGIETEVVTDENGKEVTDKDGNIVTTTVDVVYEKDKDGKLKAYRMGNDGKAARDKNGNKIPFNDTKINDTDDTPQNTPDPDRNEQNPTGTTKAGIPFTSSEQTTKFTGKEEVPKTSATGKEVNFSSTDQSIIKSMLEVPNLYLASYENADGVPISIATHTAIWMAEHEGSTRQIYPSSPVVLNLFKFYGQTVVNFKTKCNDISKQVSAPITYNAKDDTFTISEFTPKKQNVTITKIEDLGNNNFYKVTASVTGCDKKSVVAVVQKNRLDVSLGFSIKALKWS